MEDFYIKYNKVIKRVLIVPATIIAGGIIIVSIGGMAIMGGIVLVGYIIISVGECIVQNVTCIKNYIFNIQEVEEEEIRVANVEISNNSNSFTDVTELSGVSLALRIAPVIEVKIMGGEQEQEQEKEKESYMLPIAIVVSKQKIIPCMDII